MHCNSAVSISHDPADPAPLHLVGTEDTTNAPTIAPKPRAEEQLWVELLSNGLTFDLAGLAPGPACAFPEIEHRFDLERNPSEFYHESVRVVLGAHLAGAATSMPVIRRLIGLARDLAHHFEDVEAVAWTPAKSVIGRRFFESIATAWLDGGTFPALGLTAFRETIDGALQSVGLDYWVGQELRLEPPLSSDKIAATRLGVRLVNQLVIVGGLEESERVVAPDGARLIMRPSSNRKFVRVWRE